MTQRRDTHTHTKNICSQKYIILGGKMILTESCLSSVPNYVMVVFHLKGEGVL